MFNTVSARQIQREYKKVLQKANKSKEPIVVMANNKPLGAVIGLDLLEKIQLEILVSQALEDSKLGKTKVIKNMKDLKEDFQELEKYVFSKD
ncbi:MAG: type II toxin-antitoxin system prevent-host-death family antitoxin [Candidatus Daviesbacteria bacterium]|nr:type II toxin-antitoxin system prevent-host-death family antitoxin [Candidatus Daviesbacteria bacterium]